MVAQSVSLGTETGQGDGGNKSRWVWYAVGAGAILAVITLLMPKKSGDDLSDNSMSPNALVALGSLQTQLLQHEGAAGQRYDDLASLAKGLGDQLTGVSTSIGSLSELTTLGFEGIDASTTSLSQALNALGQTIIDNQEKIMLVQTQMGELDRQEFDTLMSRLDYEWKKQWEALYMLSRNRKSYFSNPYTAPYKEMLQTQYAALQELRNAYDAGGGSGYEFTLHGVGR